MALVTGEPSVTMRKTSIQLGGDGVGGDGVVDGGAVDGGVVDVRCC